MVKKLTKIGNSLALVLDRKILEATGIDAHTEVEVYTDGDVIVILPRRRGKRSANFRAAVEAINRKHAGVFRRLAE